ncbi:NHLP bacteriocin export ABC transporter permease/ATPase subunit [Flavobacterium sp.]|uniref:NHLP bacteriocin export ABC transporter permease/ATPase subunit n=1 Tax=Flavobacterium sp. TaxID=239 RepID=UPI0037BF9D36
MSENITHILEQNQSFFLDKKDRFWMVSSGEAEVFYAFIDTDGKYISKLNYLFSVKQGNLLFGLDNDIDDNFKLIVVSKNSKLIEIKVDKIQELDQVYFKSMFEKWISDIVSNIALKQNPRDFKNIEQTGSFELVAKTSLLPTKGKYWFKLKKGELNYFDNEFYEINDEHYCVIAKEFWVQVLEEESTIDVINTYQLLKDYSNLLTTLDKLKKLITKIILDDFQIKFKNETIRFEEKNKFEKSNLSKALKIIYSIVGKEYKAEYFQPENQTVNNNLFKACSKIAISDGYQLTPPKFLESYNTNTTNQLFAIAQSSNLRIRKVILRGVWWKDDNGHLLVFSQNDKKPLALIQKSPANYVLIDPETDEETVVNYEVAESLEPIAYMIFYGFVEKIDSLKKLVSLGINGLKKDGLYIILAALAGSLLGLLIPIMSGLMFDDVIPDADRSYHIEIFTIMIVIGLVSSGIQLLQGVFQLRFETKSSLNLQAGVMDHMLRLPVTFYKKFSSGDLTSRVLSINSIKQVLSNTVISSLLSGAFSIVNLILLFYYQSSLAWVGVGLAVVAIIFITIVSLNKLKYDREVSDLQGIIHGKLFEFLSGITKIKITGGENRVFSLWAKEFSNLKRLGFYSGTRQNYVDTFNASFPLFSNIVFFSIIYYMMTNAASTGAIISVGAFMAFISAFNQFLRDCLKMCFSVISSLHVITMYERVKPVLEAETESQSASTDPGELRGSIEMNSISFRYEENQPLILNEISFKIEPGEMVAFVGTSGSGKSTIMRLLLGFETPELGSIYYDGDDFTNMNKELVRKQIGVVLQNGALMSGSIFQNIIGNSELTLDDAWEAARMAGMEEDIKQMPMQMHTVISEGAGTFSGGQRQRLMIARAIVHKPRLIFMDEATSALDNRTQTIVSESLDRLKATRIVIAHRLSTIKNADRILVLDKGTIIEQGSFEELMEKNGIFAELSKRQISEQE